MGKYIISNPAILSGMPVIKGDVELKLAIILAVVDTIGVTTSNIETKSKPQREHWKKFRKESIIGMTHG